MTELEQLKQTIATLQQQLAEKQSQLDDCLGQTTEQRRKMQEPVQAVEDQDCYKTLSVCEQNWVDIPVGQFHGQPVGGFKMLSTPVTFAMYDLFCEQKNKSLPSDEGWGRADRPVINVDHQDALQYALWLSEQTGWLCELPSEEQWEYACRAGTVTHFWYGDVADNRMMVMGTGKTLPTPGDRPANPWGLYDMHGNVWEWTSTNKHEEFILCGGSWYNKANWLTSTARNIAFPNEKNNNWGFRLIRRSVT